VISEVSVHGPLALLLLGHGRQSIKVESPGRTVRFTSWGTGGREGQYPCSKMSSFFPSGPIHMQWLRASFPFSESSQENPSPMFPELCFTIWVLQNPNKLTTKIDRHKCHYMEILHLVNQRLLMVLKSITNSRMVTMYEKYLHM
jgi:hypothetical protein